MIWDRIKNLEGSRLQTKQGKEFDILDVTAANIQFAVTASGNQDKIDREVFEMAYDQFQANPNLTPTQIQDLTQSAYSASYIWGILNALK
jgi:hypothetical protein